MLVRAFAVAAITLLSSTAGAACGQETSIRSGNFTPQDNNAEVDTEHIFGFTEGSDIGKAGEREIEFEPFLRFGKRSGSYFATSAALLYKYSPSDNFRVASTLAFTSHNIDSVPGLADRSELAFQGVGTELRFRLLDRKHAPFGFTISVEPSWNRVDGASGAPIEQLNAELIGLFDMELISKRLYAAFNIVYLPQWTQGLAIGMAPRESILGFAAALSTQAAPGIFVGLEARYLRKYDGIALNSFSGEALWAGPTLFLKLPKDWFVSAAWSTQIAGGAVVEPGDLDLTNFERHQVLLRAGVTLN